MLGIITIIDMVFGILDKVNASVVLVGEILQGGKEVWEEVKNDFANVEEPTLEQIHAKAMARRAPLKPEA